MTPEQAVALNDRREEMFGRLREELTRWESGFKSAGEALAAVRVLVDALPVIDELPVHEGAKPGLRLVKA